MPARRHVSIMAGVVLVAGALILTHWWAYRKGHNAGLDVLQNNWALETATEIARGTRVLKVAKQHPELFPKSELEYWRSFVLSECTDMEKINIPYLERRGEVKRIEADREAVQQARELIAELPK